MAILPTLLILVVGLLIMVLVIPYAFSSVFKQLEVEKEINRIRGEEITRQAKVRKDIEDIETAVDTVETVELDSTAEDHPSEPDQPQPQPRSQVSAQKKRKEK